MYVFFLQDIGCTVSRNNQLQMEDVPSATGCQLFTLNKWLVGSGREEEDMSQSVKLLSERERCGFFPFALFFC